jgi:hypothetical protein
MVAPANAPGKMPGELLALMRRYNDLGLLLPRGDTDELMDDLCTRLTVELILTEMAQVQAEIFAFIGAARVS